VCCLKTRIAIPDCLKLFLKFDKISRITITGYMKILKFGLIEL
jgi:hypothetical protein